MLAKLLLAHFLKDIGPQLLLGKFQKAEPRVIAGMHSKGMEPPNASLKVLTRDALFRLIHSVIPSGDVSDVLRDLMDNQVVKLVETGLNEQGQQSLAAIVAATARAAVKVAFP